jgi:hypothetical protein
MRLKIAVSVVRFRPWAPRFAFGYAWRSRADEGEAVRLQASAER